MAPFFTVHVSRSDGRVTVTKASNAKEDNAPLPEQLDTKPNEKGICDYYRECQPGEGKEVDWRRKLGGMLIRELQPERMSNKNFILSALPEGYRLYEHVRHAFADSSEPSPKLPKNHAAGSNERQDAYLYGHPQGRKKRYRSPAEYFPHLLWLATDAKFDSNNCSCKFCSPEEIEAEVKQMVPAQDIKQSLAMQDHEITPAISFPRLRSREQKLDAQYNQFLFRPGELIWFERDKTSWGLGVIISREANDSNPDLYQYRVQPLTHPLAHRASVACNQSQLRAWLAWSPPPCLNPELNPNAGNNMTPPTYHTVDWQAYLHNKMGEKNAEIDGSILIAKFVDTTFTIFDRIESKTSTKDSGPASEIYYNGFFLGAEKIWLGDPLRLRNGANPNDMMVLHSIIEKPAPSDPSKSGVILKGNIYSQSIVDQDSDAIAEQTAALPLRVQEDLKARNALARQAVDPSKRSQVYWKIEAMNCQRSLAEIKGRWYESSILMPIIAPSEYEAGRQRGELGDATVWMNGQGDCNKPPNSPPGSFRAADTKVKQRKDAFGRAVPPLFKISKGLDDPTYSEAAGSAVNKSAPTERSAHAPPSTQQRAQQAPPQVPQRVPIQLPQQPQPDQTHGSQYQSTQVNSSQAVNQYTYEQFTQPNPNVQDNLGNPQQAQNEQLNFEFDPSRSNVDMYMDFSYTDEQPPGNDQMELQHQQYNRFGGQGA